MRRRTPIAAWALLVLVGCQSDYERGLQQGKEDAGNLYMDEMAKTDVNAWHYHLPTVTDTQPAEQPGQSAEYTSGYNEGWRWMMGEFRSTLDANMPPAD